jgi:hypothetical protein
MLRAERVSNYQTKLGQFLNWTPPSLKHQVACEMAQWPAAVDAKHVTPRSAATRLQAERIRHNASKCSQQHGTRPQSTYAQQMNKSPKECSTCSRALPHGLIVKHGLQQVCMQAAAALQHVTGAMRTPLKSHKVCASISWCTPHIHTVCTHHLLDQPAWYIMHAPACYAMQGAAPLCTTPPLAVESQVQRRAWPPLLYQQNDVRSEVTAKLKHARNPGAAHKLLAARAGLRAGWHQVTGCAYRS